MTIAAALWAALAVVCIAAIFTIFLVVLPRLLYSSEQSGTIDEAPQPAEPPQDHDDLGGQPMSESRYKTLERVVDALEDAGLDEATVSTVKTAYETANPSAFADEATLSDAEFRKRTVEFTRRHLRRFPRTQSALALSLRALAKGETTKYQP